MLRRFFLCFGGKSWYDDQKAKGGEHMKKQYDIVALGELLIDFTENGVSAQGNPLFEANPGGAPCNLLAMAAKLGDKCAFIGKVGDDIFGRQLRAALQEAGIDDTALLTDPDAPTTLAFVKNGPDGEREFTFLRENGADIRLRPEDLPEELLQSARIFHFGSLSLTHEGVRAATRRAVEIARASGALVSFDPNLRPALWDSLDQASEQIAWGLAQCDILKIADNEAVFMTGEDEPHEAALTLRRQYPNIRLLFLTRGAGGSSVYHESGSVYVPACRLGDAVDTTGAGDTFGGCVLHHVLLHGIHRLNNDTLPRVLRYANAAAGLITQRKGALRSMPTREEILGLLK